MLFSAADALLCLMPSGTGMKLFAAPKSRENVNEMLTEVKLGARKFPAKFNYIRITYGERSILFGFA